MHFDSLCTPKKKLGQHFLRSPEVIEKIGAAIFPLRADEALVEIGPGEGALTDALIGGAHPLFLIELDARLIPPLEKKYGTRAQVIHGDFLQVALDHVAVPHCVVVGNFPYSISAPIFFKLLAMRDRVRRVVCMVQHEVALRLTAPPGSKSYGILSVLLGAFYQREYLFSVPREVFYPPPKVLSGVICLERNAKKALDCGEELFMQVVKSAFGQRRKMIRNALRPLGRSLERVPRFLMTKRAEELSVEDFVVVTQALSL